MGQSIQEWTKQVLYKTAFKKFEGIWSYIPSNFLKAVFHKTNLLFSINLTNFVFINEWLLDPLTK